MPSARLRLDSLLKQPILDLKAICEVIRGDIGLGIEALRLCHSQGISDASQIQNLIVTLGTEFLLGWLHQLNLSESKHRPSISKLATHSRLVANAAETIARYVPGVEPQQAYFAGLLHDIGKLPSLTGTTDLAIKDTEHVELGLFLVQAWGLPDFIADGIQFPHFAPSNKLARVLGAAHEWATDHNDHSVQARHSVAGRWLSFLSSKERELLLHDLENLIKPNVPRSTGRVELQLVRASN